MHVRSFQLSDVTPVTELLQIALSEECYESTMEPFSRQLSWDSDLIVVAEHEDEIVGALIGTIEKNHGCYFRIAVHPDFRRQGVGKSLVAAMEHRFQARKVSGIFVAVDEHNSFALPLYEALGYNENQVFKSVRKLSIVG
ncbi:GNAT family N-acetyltransferase [Paenibacillus sp. NFR01]|uniref:GNAT family N-acetyltransferase n=1 Tax=Paenibacillus sp. NFR01 TaxID=1566279 RepID=UPI0008BD5DFB|nr:GNAT family N-acetyltransferase [Paenibacillus sp. NFR01]SEU29190.1 Acetyltransferase (GNAT) family protein [Paenibacillus sp. NFR01]